MLYNYSHIPRDATMTAHTKAIVSLDGAEIEYRRARFEEARASCALEGIAFDEDMLADVDRLISGEMTNEEFGRYIAEKYAGRIVHTVGHRKEPQITFSASAALLKEGARFNDEIHRLPTGNLTFIPKGVYYFKTHEEANRHAQNCLVRGMALIAQERA